MDIRLTWDAANARCDWTVVAGQLDADASLESVVLLLLFTDRRAQPDYVPPDGDRRGWPGDAFAPELQGSRLYQLEARKIVNRAALAAEAVVMCDEALAPIVAAKLADRIVCTATCPAPGPNQAGNLLVIRIAVTLPDGRTTPFSYSVPLKG